MSSEKGRRIEEYCKVIWGEYEYDLDLETDGDHYSYVVRKDYGTSLGHPLTITGVCNSSGQAGKELERMLKAWADQVQSGEPMTKAQSLEIFGGPNGQSKRVLSQFWDVRERRMKHGEY